MAYFRLTIAAATSLLYCAVAPAPAVAQQASGGATSDSREAIEEIVVTAQRRAESIQNVPMSVQAIQLEELQNRNVSSLMELQRLSPALTVQQTGSSTSPFLRGVGSVNAGAGQFGSVAVYVDGVYVGQQTAGSFDLDNAEQVQLLKGPQGALYGRNATGGAIVVNTPTPRPGDEFNAQLSAGFGNFSSQSYFGSVHSSFGERAAGYLTASSRRHDGYVENLNPAGTGGHSDDLNDGDSWGASGALTFEPTERLSFVLRGSHFDQEDRSGLGFQAVGLDIPVAGPLNGTQAYYAGTLQAFGVPPEDAFAAASGLQFSTAFGETYDNERNGFQNGILPDTGLPGAFIALEVDRASLTAAYRFDHVEISSLTAYSDSLNRIAIDFITASPTSYPPGLQGGAIGFSAHDSFEDFQQEIQLSSIDTPISWVGGVLYIDTEGDNTLSADLPGGLSFIPGRNTWGVESTSVYAQATVPLSGPWSATAGARYTDETFELVDRLDPADPTSLPGLPNFGTQSIDSSKTTYTARLEYDNGPFLAYAGVATGFKGASLNPNNPGSPPVDPEELTSYEAGIKWNPSPSVEVNGAVFNYDYDNIQVSYVDAASGANVLVNGSSAGVTGLEVQGTVAATDWLSLRAGVLWLDTEYDNDVQAASGTLVVLPIRGNRLGGAPENVFSVGADASFAVANGDLTGSIDALRSGGYYFDALNLVGTGGATADSYATVDISLKYAPATGPWWVAVRGVNVLDEEYFQSGLVASGILREASAATPAIYDITIGVDF